MIRKREFKVTTSPSMDILQYLQTWVAWFSIFGEWCVKTAELMNALSNKDNMNWQTWCSDSGTLCSWIWLRKKLVAEITCFYQTELHRATHTPRLPSVVYSSKYQAVTGDATKTMIAMANRHVPKVVAVEAGNAGAVRLTLKLWLTTWHFRSGSHSAVDGLKQLQFVIKTTVAAADMQAAVRLI